MVDKAKKLLNGYSTNLLLIIVSGLLTFILVDMQTFQGTITTKVDKNSEHIIEAIECNKHWKETVMNHAKLIHDNQNMGHENREDIIKISTKTGVSIRGKADN